MIGPCSRHLSLIWGLTRILRVGNSFNSRLRTRVSPPSYNFSNYVLFSGASVRLVLALGSVVLALDLTDLGC